MLAAFALCAMLSTFAQATVYLKLADEFGTIQPGGPRAALNGNRFWTIEGSDNGENASTAPVRFYMADIIAQADAEFGAGQWEVTNVNFVFFQRNAFFTHEGLVNLYWFENDEVAITNGENDGGSADPGNFGDAGLAASPLRYSSGANVLDTVLSDGTTDATTIFGNHTLVDTYTFYNSGSSDGNGDDGDWPLDV